jgi:hypothetical protein
MSGFVDEVRREWKRLGVPDRAADEMAADLQADLDEAARDGATPVDLLGTDADDPRGFAEAWARERGLIGAAPTRSRSHRRLLGGALALLVIGFAAFAVTASVHKVRVVSGSGPHLMQTVTITRMTTVQQTRTRVTAVFSSHVGFTRMAALTAGQRKMRARAIARRRAAQRAKRQHQVPAGP